LFDEKLKVANFLKCMMKVSVLVELKIVIQENGNQRRFVQENLI